MLRGAAERVGALVLRAAGAAGSRSGKRSGLFLSKYPPKMANAGAEAAAAAGAGVSKLADIGVIGLAVMGENLALNFSRYFTVAVFNRTTAVSGSSSASASYFLGRDILMSYDCLTGCLLDENGLPVRNCEVLCPFATSDNDQLRRGPRQEGDCHRRTHARGVRCALAGWMACVHECVCVCACVLCARCC